MNNYRSPLKALVSDIAELACIALFLAGIFIWFLP